MTTEEYWTFCIHNRLSMSNSVELTRKLNPLQSVLKTINQCNSFLIKPFLNSFILSSLIYFLRSAWLCKSSNRWDIEYTLIQQNHQGQGRFQRKWFCRETYRSRISWNWSAIEKTTTEGIINDFIIDPKLTLWPGILIN